MNEIIPRQPIFGPPKAKDQALPATKNAAATSKPANRLDRKRSKRVGAVLRVERQHLPC